MKKLESINNILFGTLKQSEINNLNMILGGACSSTLYDSCDNKTSTDGCVDTKIGNEIEDDPDRKWVAISPVPVCNPVSVAFH